MTELTNTESVENSDKKKNHYVDNAKFYQALVEYRAEVLRCREVGLPDPIVSNYIGECFMKIARGVAMKHNFRDYSYINDMISCGVETCLRRIMSFNPEKSKSPFSYFTQTIWYAFIGVISDEHRQAKKKRMAFMNMDIDTFTAHMADEGDDFQISLNDYLNSLGTDSDPVSYESKKKKKPVTPLTDMFEEA